MDRIYAWIESNVGPSILISAIIGPILVGIVVGVVFDLWLRPKVEAKKTKRLYIENLSEEVNALFSTVLAGLVFAYGYDKFNQNDSAVKTRVRVLTLTLENEYENIRQLSSVISKLGVYYQFNEEFTQSTIETLAVAAGNIMRIRDTVEERNFNVFNGINKKTLDSHINEIRTLQKEVNFRISGPFILKRFIKRT